MIPVESLSADGTHPEAVPPPLRSLETAEAQALELCDEVGPHCSGGRERLARVGRFGGQHHEVLPQKVREGGSILGGDCGVLPVKHAADVALRARHEVNLSGDEAHGRVR